MRYTIYFLLLIISLLFVGCEKQYIYVNNPPTYVKTPPKFDLDVFNGTRCDDFGNILINEQNLIGLTSYTRELENVIYNGYEGQIPNNRGTTKWILY